MIISRKPTPDLRKASPVRGVMETLLQSGIVEVPSGLRDLTEASSVCTRYIRAGRSQEKEFFEGNCLPGME